MKNPSKTVDLSETRDLRIVCISDTHGLHRKLLLSEADILIHAGDFMVHGRSTEEIDDFNDWLGSLPFRHRIVIAGNRDYFFESSPAEARDRLPKLFIWRILASLWTGSPSGGVRNAGSA
jgi:predicted phosphodiesterase